MISIRDGIPGCACIRSRPSVQLVLEDDRGRFPIHPGAVCLALGRRRRPARATSLHRPEPLLGQMARQSFIPEADRQPDEWRDRRHPLSRVFGLRARLTRGLEWKPNDELLRIMRGDDRRESPCVGFWRPGPADGLERPRRAAIAICDGEADPPFPQVDPEQSPHGDADAPDPGDSSGAPDSPGFRGVVDVSAFRLTRASIVGMAVTQSGQTERFTSPYC